jgi:hypothetical protein
VEVRQREDGKLTSRVDGRGDCDIVALCLPLVLCFCDCDALRLPCVSPSLLEIQTIRAQKGGKKTSAIRARNSQESVQEACIPRQRGRVATLQAE